MPSTYTLNNGIELIGTGEQSGTWGDTTNTNLELLDTALDGQVTITASSAGSSGSPNSLPITDGSASNGRNRLVNITSATDLGSTVFYQLTPNDAEKIVYIRNSLNTQDLIVFQGTYNSSNDYLIPNGTTAVVFFNGAGSGAVAANVFNNAHFDALNVESAASTTAITIDNTATDGDPILGFALSGTNTFTMGVDDGDSDKFKIGTTAIGTNTRLSIDSSGDVEIPSGSLTITSANALTLRNDTATDADEPKITFDNDTFAGANYANIRTGNGGLLLKIESPSTSTFQNRHQLVFNGGSGDDFQYNLSTDNGSNYVNYFKIDGGNVVFNEGGVDRDFRVESDNNANMLFVDAGNDRIGVGTAPSTLLHLKTSGNADTAQEINVGLDNGSASDPVAIEIKQLGGTTSDGLYTFKNYIGGALRSYFWTSRDNMSVGVRSTIATQDGSGTIRDRITMDVGETVINDGGIDQDFRVESDANANFLLLDASAEMLLVGGGANTAGGAAFKVSQGNDGEITLDSTSSESNIVSYDRNGGAYHPLNLLGSNISFSPTSGNAAIFNEASLDADFRVESNGNANMLFVDAGSDHVSIGTGEDRGGVLNVESSDNNYTVMLSCTDDDNNAGPWLGFDRRTGSAADNDTIGSIAFLGRNSAAEQTSYCEIRNVTTDVTDGTEDGQMQFNVISGGSFRNFLHLTGSAQAVFNEDSHDIDFRVESNLDSHMLFVDGGTNRVGINISSPSAPLHLQAGSSGGSLGDAFQISDNTYVNIAMYSGGADGEIRIGAAGVLRGSYKAQYAGTRSANDFHVGVQDTTGMFSIDGGGGSVILNDRSADTDFRVESNAYSTMFQVDAGNNWVSIGQAVPATGFDGDLIVMGSSASTTTSPVRINRSTDGYLIRFMESNNTEGYISVSGTTVSYNGFAGRHESSGIPTTTARGTVVSTIDELDVYLAGPKQGQARTDHAKVEVSNTVGDPCVYGVVDDYTETGAVNVVSVGIGAVLVTGSCAKGDLLESNGDGTAKVQSDDIVRSKTLGKVTIGNSDAGVKLVPCVMYCG